MTSVASFASSPSNKNFGKVVTRLLAVVAFGLAASVAVPANAANILINGGFEEGDFTGWTLNDASGFTSVQCPGAGPAVAEGFCSAALGANVVEGTLSQTFATTVGGEYLLSFAFLWDGGTPSAFTAFIDGIAVFSRVDPPALSDFGLGAVSFLATGLSTTLTFSFVDEPGFILLDAVSVSALVPEPASVALVALGLVSLALMRRRRAV